MNNGTISKEEVTRNEQGFWTHSRLPKFGENETTEVINEWADLLGGKFEWVMMDGTATDDVFAKYEADGSVCDWYPTYGPDRNAILLSIHDTEDGPTAWFFVPK